MTLKNYYLCFFVIVFLLVANKCLPYFQPQQVAGPARNDALDALDNGSLQNILLAFNETKIIEFPDGSAIKLWVIDDGGDANELAIKNLSGFALNGRKIANVSIKNTDSDEYGVTLKLKVDYQYGDHYLKVTAFDAWAESKWGYQLVFDRSRTSAISSSSDSTAMGYYNAEYRNRNSLQGYKIAPILSIKLSSGEKSQTMVFLAYSGCESWGWLEITEKPYI